MEQLLFLEITLCALIYDSHVRRKAICLVVVVCLSENISLVTILRFKPNGEVWRITEERMIQLR